MTKHNKTADQRIDEWRYRNGIPDVPLAMTGLSRYKHFDPFLVNLNSGDRLTLVRRPRNRADKNAIEVLKSDDGMSLGFLQREVAAVLAPQIEAGADLDAYFHYESDVASGLVVIAGEGLYPVLRKLANVELIDDPNSGVHIKMPTSDATIAWYDENAKTYAANSDRCEPKRDMEAFLHHLPPGSRILDAGCGAGRDALRMTELGYQVGGFDASSAMCEMANSRVGGNFRARHMKFSDFQDEPGTWDGIWAMASLLHVDPVDMPDAVGRLMRSLKPGGTFFAALKAGDENTIEPDGRRMTRVTRDQLAEIFASLGGEMFIDERPVMKSNGQVDNWLNVIFRKAPELVLEPQAVSA